MRRIIVTGAALMALAGCGGGGAPEADRGNAARPAQGSLASPDGRSEVRGDADFSGLPEGIPAYPRANASGGIQFGVVEDGAEMRIMGFRTADPPAQVIAFYADAAPGAGFRVVQRATSGPRSTLGLERDNGDVLNVTATGAPAGTSVQIMAGRERRR